MWYPQTNIRWMLPVVDSDDSDIPLSELSLDKQKARGQGLRCKRYKSAVTITHRPSATTISAKTDLGLDDAAALIEDLLHSELAHRQLLQSAPASLDQENAVQVEDIIRKYTLHPRPSVRDARTGVTTTHLNELWKGALDEFLYAALEMRKA